MKRHNLIENRRRHLSLTYFSDHYASRSYFRRMANAGHWKLLLSRSALQYRRPGHPVLAQLP